ncbi:hypothetical protein SDC9_96887 [bioreactor metagenome]|uniref:Uncharacterized protein n=1 Tax=bioreactor metagenome TaxID=1076179 RepID=A0A645ACZ4_9ZZZZ|nr:SIR2 family protein [Anaerotignum propionicum]MEA5056118.1 SIR2 family protein [Anaerotignum propionicum]
METVNIIHHMNEFRNILSYATNIGFFFGAGTSCAFGLPDIMSLTVESKASLSSSQQILFDKIETSLKDLGGKAKVSIEDILNYVRQIREITQGRPDYDFSGISGDEAVELDKAICKAVFDVIKEKEAKADVSDIRRFMAWYDSANRGFVKEIYTTNYDMLLEMAMEANYTSYFDGFTGSYEPFFSPESIEVFPNDNDSTSKWLRLWKIHGSLNWMKKESSTISSERIVRIGKIDTPINELMIYPSKEKYNLSRKEPFIAYFDRMKQYLQRGELVFICTGYSFLDQHINDIIFNAMRQNKRLYVMVLCYLDDQVDTMSSYATAHMNLCVMGPTRMIANGIEREWIYDESTDADVGYKLYWDEMKKEFILGDFRKLIEFLIENSGRKSMIEEIANEK